MAVGRLAKDKLWAVSDVLIGIDIGGTQVKGVTMQDHKIIGQQSVETDDGKQWQNKVKEIYSALRREADNMVQVVGLSAPGIAREDCRAIAYMPHRLEGLEQFDWSAFLNTDVTVINDAHAALWAEYKVGNGVGKKDLAILTLGTGVGGGLLLSGQLHTGFLQRAGHLGHMTIDAGSASRSIAGTPGSLEDAIGEATLERRSHGIYRFTQDLVRDYCSGDPWAAFIWLNSIQRLATGVVSICNAFSPEMVILAGGITKAGDHLMKPLNSFLDRYEWRPTGQRTEVCLSGFKDYAGAIGAALYAADHQEGP